MAPLFMAVWTVQCGKDSRREEGTRRRDARLEEGRDESHASGRRAHKAWECAKNRDDSSRRTRVAALLPQKPPSCVFDKSNMASTSAGQQQPAQASSSATAAAAAGNSTPLLATGDWTKSLIQLAKTAELKCVHVVVAPPV